MKDREFQSHFADDIINFVNEKRALGFKYDVEEYYLMKFDQLCLNRFPSQTILTDEIMSAWIVKTENETKKTLRNRTTPVTDLAKYLNRQGQKAFILPSGTLPKAHRYVPYIFSHEELRVLFNEFDLKQIEISDKITNSHLVPSVFFRLLYCCGLRPGEARRLQLEDVNLADGTIKIIDSKNHKDRIVVMSDDVRLMCAHYRNAMSKTKLAHSPWFFPSRTGEAYTVNWVNITFREAIRKANIGQNSPNPPRAYDLRHTFATHRLYQWMREDKDLYTVLPYLSAYMGHADFSSTEYYIHFVPGIFEQMSGFDFSCYEKLLPEVNGYEV